MLTCLVLVDDPPRCSECRKKIEMKINDNKKDEFILTVSSDEYFENQAIDKYFIE